MASPFLTYAHPDGTAAADVYPDRIEFRGVSPPYQDRRSRSAALKVERARLTALAGLGVEYGPHRLAVPEPNAVSCRSPVSRIALPAPTPLAEPNPPLVVGGVRWRAPEPSTFAADVAAGKARARAEEDYRADIAAYARDKAAGMFD